MAVLFLVAFTTLFLEHDDFFATNVLQNFAGYGDARHSGGTNLHGAVVVNQQNLVENEGSAFLAHQSVGVEVSVFLNFELLTCDFYDCVHDVGTV